MGTFKVPSPTPSPTSSQGSPRGSPTTRRSPGRPLKAILKVRRSPGRTFRVPSATPSPTSSEANADDERSPDIPAPTRETPTREATKRPNLGSDFQNPIVLSDGAFSSSESSDDTKEVGRYEMAHEPPNDTVSDNTLQAIQNLLNHPNIVPLVNNDDGQEDDASDDSISEFGAALKLNDLILSRAIPYPSRKKTGLLAESLIWHTLISLLRAAHYLHTGGRSSREEWGGADWPPVVNNFFNPTNIIYTEPQCGDEGDEATYGTCMLQNFGRCVVLPRIVDPEDEDETENERADRKQAFSHVSALAGETGFEAPEHFGYTDDIPGPASDLWSIGAVIVAMMTGRNVWDLVLEGDFIKEARDERNRRGSLPERWQDVDSHQRIISLMALGVGKLAFALPKRYGESLKIVVECLLAFNPLERGSALDVLRDVEPMYRVRLLDVGEEALKHRW